MDLSMTTEDADIPQPATEPVIQDAPAAPVSAPATDTPTDGDAAIAVALTADGEPVVEPAGEGEPSLAGDEPMLSLDTETDADAEVEALGEADSESGLDLDAEQVVASDEEELSAEEVPEPPPPRPIQLVLWNEKVPASAGCWVFWREAGFECRGKIERGLFTATCKGYGGSAKSQPIELLLRRRFVSQGEAIAVMDRMLSFDPHDAESLGFEICGRAMIPFLPASGALDEEQAAVSS